MILSLGLVFLAVLLTGVSQVLLKRGAGNNDGYAKRGILAPYLNSYTISAYGLLLFTTIISVIALRTIPLKLFYAIASLNFLVVATFSWIFLKEEISRRMLIGIGLIVGGVVVFNL